MHANSASTTGHSNPCFRLFRIKFYQEFLIYTCKPSAFSSFSLFSCTQAQNILGSEADYPWKSTIFLWPLLSRFVFHGILPSKFLNPKPALLQARVAILLFALFPSLRILISTTINQGRQPRLLLSTLLTSSSWFSSFRSIRASSPASASPLSRSRPPNTRCLSIVGKRSYIALPNS